MTALDIAHLEALTKDYAAFRARKSGLATALGGTLVIALFLLYALMIFSHHPRWPRPWIYVLSILVYGSPLLWALAKPLLVCVLYRGLGEVKLRPDVAQERQRWRWIHGLALFLLLFQSAALLGFVQGFLGSISHSLSPNQIPLDLPFHWRSWLWVVVMPCVYALLAPWCIRGAEEARTYAVLVAGCVLWTVVGFSFAVVQAPTSRIWLGSICAFTLVLTLGWALRAIHHGWREHQEYRSMLLGLPPVDSTEV